MSKIHNVLIRLWKAINILIGSVALSGKILFVEIVENNKIDAYFRAG